LNACGIDFMELVVMAHLRLACQDALVDRTDGGGEFSPDNVNENENGVFCRHLNRWNELIESIVSFDSKNPLSNFLQRLKSCLDVTNLSTLINDLLNSDDASGSGVVHWSAVCLGVAALNEFVRINWTTTTEKDCGAHFPGVHPDLVRAVLIDSVNGESLDVSVRCEELLCLARAIFCQPKGRVANVFKDDWVFQWWKLRTLATHFKVISQHSYAIYEDAKSVIDALSVAQFPNDDRTFAIRCAVETSLFYSHYFESSRAETWMEKAASLAGLEVTGTGALGKRTYFQRKNTNHFVLDINRKSDSPQLREDKYSLRTGSAKELTNIKLSDETRRDRIEYAEKREPIDLSPTEQCVMLGLYSFIRKSEARTQVSDTKLYPHLEAVLDSNVQVWAVKLRSLLERSKLESGEMKCVERALQQVEGLVQSLRGKNEVSSTNTDHDESHKMDLVYTSGLVPSWEVEADLVRLYLSLGLTKAALEIALKLEMWETVIDCYHRIDLKHKAAEVIQNKINTNGESAKLLCMLGDATENVECYHRALAVSNNRSARAYKSLGLIAYSVKDYPEAIRLLNLSIEINKFQLSVLSRLGYSAMQVEDWKTGARAYREYCSFDSESFEAWNNLARCYVSLEEYDKAWNIFQEAAKRNYDNWQIWDNVLTISTKCGHFDAVLKAYHRILDIRDDKSQGSSHPSAAKMKAVADSDVLGFLAKAITTRQKDSNGDDCEKYLQKSIELCARVATHSPKDAEFYQIYAGLVSFDGQTNTGRQGACDFRAAQMLQKGCAVKAGEAKDWSLTTEGCQGAANFAASFADACLAASTHEANKAQSIPQLGSAKMSIRSILSHLQKRLQNCTTDEKLKDSACLLETKISQITVRVAALNCNQCDVTKT